MFSGCSSVCACVRARAEAFSGRLAVDFQFIIVLIFMIDV